MRISCVNVNGTAPCCLASAPFCLSIYEPLAEHGSQPTTSTITNFYRLCIHNMSASIARNDFSQNEPNDNQAETLVNTERWWRNCYDVIAEQGYRIGARYNPQWDPSWFSITEDGQATIVRVLTFLTCPSPKMSVQVEGGNGRDSHTRWPSSHAQKSPS